MFQLRHRWGAIAAVVLFGAVIAVAAALEEVWVKIGYVDLREGPRAIHKVVVRAPKGAKLTVVERNSAGWLKVEYTTKEGETHSGWVHQDSISNKKVGQGLGGLFADSSDTSGMDTSAAGKGLRSEAEAYAADKNMDPKRVDAVIEFTQSITPEELDKFESEGKLGAYKPAE